MQVLGSAAAEAAPATELLGFNKPDLNGLYRARLKVIICDNITYWHVTDKYFAYFQHSLQRWSVCGKESFADVRGGAQLGWAFQMDEAPGLCSGKWMERLGNEWSETMITASPAKASTAAGTATPCQQQPDLLNGSAFATVATSGYQLSDTWDRNVRPRRDAGPDQLIGIFGGGKADEEDSSGMSPINWASLRLPAFQKEFVPYQVTDFQEAVSRRLEMQIEIEEDPAGLGATPVPIRNFSELGCFPDWLLQALRDNAWEHPMPIQAQALPILLAGKNLIGVAQTGSGKTASFLLPSVVHIEAQPPLTRQSPGPVVLVLAPTRELAVQISDEATKLLKFSHGSRRHPDGMNSVNFYGGGRKWQQLKWFGDTGSHILVATPGRLLDFMQEKSVSLQRVTYLVFDEADRMLDLGFSGDMKTISDQVRPERQVAYFSATWPKAVQALAEGFCMYPPVRLRIGGASEQAEEVNEDGEGELMPNAREGITQEVVVLEAPEDGNWQETEEEKMVRIKTHVLDIFKEDDDAKVLIFVNEKGQVDKLAHDLWDQGIYADGIHSGRKQEMRLEVLEQFRQGKIRVLVATDVIGRGLDIPKVSHVVVHTMGNVDDYVHRIGRTGRGKDGTGHALVFFEYFSNRPKCAERLIGVLERAKQHVPFQLRKIASEVESGVRQTRTWGTSSWGSRSWKDGNSWKSGGWSNGGSWKSGS